MGQIQITIKEQSVACESNPAKACYVLEIDDIDNNNNPRHRKYYADKHLLDKYEDAPPSIIFAYPYGAYLINDCAHKEFEQLTTKSLALHFHKKQDVAAPKNEYGIAYAKDDLLSRDYYKWLDAPYKIINSTLHDLTIYYLEKPPQQVDQEPIYNKFIIGKDQAGCLFIDKDGIVVTKAGSCF